MPGAPDLVDVNFKVEEGPSAQLGGGIGYSESQSFILNGNYADSNFMGTGKRIALELNSGRYSKVYSFSHTNPYVSVDNLSRTYSLTYRDVTQFVSASSDFGSKTIAAGIDYSYPITEFQYLRFGAVPAARAAPDQRLRQRRAGHGLGAQQRQLRIAAHRSTMLRHAHHLLRHQVQHGGAARRLELRHAATARCSPTAARATRCPCRTPRRGATSSTTSRTTSS